MPELDVPVLNSNNEVPIKVTREKCGYFTVVASIAIPCCFMVTVASTCPK